MPNIFSKSIVNQTAVFIYVITLALTAVGTFFNTWYCFDLSELICGLFTLFIVVVNYISLTVSVNLRISPVKNPGKLILWIIPSLVTIIILVVSTISFIEIERNYIDEYQKDGIEILQQVDNSLNSINDINDSYLKETEEILFAYLTISPSDSLLAGKPYDLGGLQAPLPPSIITQIRDDKMKKIKKNLKRCKSNSNV